MSTRKLFAALALVVVGMLAMPGVADAQRSTRGAVTRSGGGESASTDNAGSEGGELTHENEECIELLESGKDVDDCQEAPSPILPATNEVIWGVISFAVLLVLMAKFALPNLRNMMEERTERIRGDLDAAETAKTEAVGIREEYARQLADAKTEAARIIEEARQAADSVRKDLIQRAEADAAELRQRNAEQLEGERGRIMGELQGQVATLAIELAEKVVEANLDPDAQNRLIESYISSVATK